MGEGADNLKSIERRVKDLENQSGEGIQMFSFQIIYEGETPQETDPNVAVSMIMRLDGPRPADQE
jgi:hypothetical protein